jgi:hypothetical protein
VGKRVTIRARDKGATALLFFAPNGTRVDLKLSHGEATVDSDEVVDGQFVLAEVVPESQATVTAAPDKDGNK